MIGILEKCDKEVNSIIRNWKRNKGLIGMTCIIFIQTWTKGMSFKILIDVFAL